MVQISKNKKENEYDNFDDDFDFDEQVIITKNKKISFTYNIFIDDDIIKPSKYRKIYDVIKNATKNDTINFIINTFGGWVDTFVEIYNLMMETKAKTIAEIYTANSAGSLLSLSCDEIKVKEFACMMIHTCSCGDYGKLEEVKSSIKFIDKRWNKIMNKIYEGFLSQHEIEQVKNGKDFWLDEKQIKKRLKKWVPIKERR